MSRGTLVRGINVTTPQDMTWFFNGPYRAPKVDLMIFQNIYCTFMDPLMEPKVNPASQIFGQP